MPTTQLPRTDHLPEDDEVRQAAEWYLGERLKDVATTYARHVAAGATGRPMAIAMAELHEAAVEYAEVAR